MNLLMIVIGFMVVSIVKFFCAFIIVFRKFARPVFNFNMATLWSLSKKAFPFGLGSVFVRIFTRIDTVMLSKMATMTIIGYYNAAYKPRTAYQSAC